MCCLFVGLWGFGFLVFVLATFVVPVHCLKDAFSYPGSVRERVEKQQQKAY